MMGCCSTKSPVPTLRELQTKGTLLQLIQEHYNEEEISLIKSDADDLVLSNIQDAVLGKKIIGGLHQHTYLAELRLKNDCGQPVQMVNQQNQDSMQAFCKVSKRSCLHDKASKIGKYHREAAFYQHIKSHDIKFEHCHFAKTYLTLPDSQNGTFLLLMEYIEGSNNCMKAFGEWEFKQRPNLERSIDLGGDNLTAIQLSQLAAKAFAEFHAHFWMDKKFLGTNKEWIRRSQWICDKDFANYDKGMKTNSRVWKLVQRGIFKGSVKTPWNPLVKAVIDGCFQKSTGDNFKQTYLQPLLNWTMTHNDGHPGNFIWDPNQKRLVMADMEMFGFGIGPSDLCTWLIIRSDPKWRRKYEKEVVELYYETLIEYGEKFGTLTRDSYSLDDCWNQYRLYGALAVIKYVIFLPITTHMHVNLDLQDSFGAFLEDHGVTPENVPPFIW